MQQRDKVNVVLFSGGRGSRVLSRQLINNPQVVLTLAVNGYDDGASTGEVRRFLGDALGPSDFRKNASWLAGQLHCCARGLIDLLDFRFPVPTSNQQALDMFRLIGERRAAPESDYEAKLIESLSDMDKTSRDSVSCMLEHFKKELTETASSFSFSDCSLGNLVFAGCYLQHARRFNDACDAYYGLFNLPKGLIENVTDGSNAYLVALDRRSRVLASEAEIVDANRRNQIEEIYLIDQPFTEHELQGFIVMSPTAIRGAIEKRATTPPANQRLLRKIEEADIVVYSPGTQYSSLFPSYLTPGIGAAIAKNLTAVKLLITNLYEETKQPDINAVDTIQKAVYFLREKDQLRIPKPCLITHYIINDPDTKCNERPYVPLGRIQTLEDPRLARIGNYEEGGSGKHDAASVVTPFVESFLKKGYHPKVDVWLCETHSHSKICQTVLEMLRGGIANVPIQVDVFYECVEPLDETFVSELPFSLHHVSTCQDDLDKTTWMVGGRKADYVMMFDSNGMYTGEDIVSLASLLTHERWDAVWGSRRISVNDIKESYKIRYRNKLVFGAISSIGSYCLSLAYLLLYGRYFSDTLSGIKIIRASLLHSGCIDANHKYVNQHLLSLLARHRAEVLEAPVQFFSISPEKVRRTSILDGLRALATIFVWRFKSLARENTTAEVSGILRTRRQNEIAAAD